jgi:hypothetical protein
MQAPVDRAQDQLNEWLARHSGSSSGPAVTAARSTFVLRPGGAPGGNVFPDWPSLYAVYSQVQGPRWVWLDASLAPITIPAAGQPAGGWNVDNTTWGTYANGSDFLAGIVTFAQGAQLAFTTMTVQGNVTFQSASTLPVVTMVNGGTIWMKENCQILSEAGKAPFAVVVAGHTGLVVVLDNSLLGDGVTPVLGGTAGSFFVAAYNQSDIAGNFWANAGAGMTLSFDANTTIGTPQTGVALIPVDTATKVSYDASPGGANWNPVPVLVKNALNQLAQTNSLNDTNVASLGPANIVSFRSVGTLTRQGAGLYLVTAAMFAGGGDSVPGERITVSLIRDLVVIKTTIVTAAASGDWSAEISALDSAADLLPHFWRITCQGNAGNLTVGIGGASVFAVEQK